VKNGTSWKYNSPVLGILLCLCLAPAWSQSAPVPWADHFSQILPDGFDPWCGPVVGVDGPTSVAVATYTLPNGGAVELYYPSAEIPPTPLPAVLLVSGISDSQTVAETGRPWMHQSQAMGWGRLCAEHGLVAITYENGGRPAEALRLMGEWLQKKASEIGVDVERLGTWSASNSCATAIEAYRTGHQALGGLSPSFGVFFYGDLTLKSDHDVTIPLMVVRVADDAWADSRLMERFVQRVVERGGTVQFLTHQTGSHAFDVKGDTEESREIMAATFEFMTQFGTRY